MTRSELIASLAAKFPALSEADIDIAVHEILRGIRQALARGDRAEIRGFGVFELKHRSARKGRNPKTGESVIIGAKSIPHFKAGKEMRERVDASLQIEPTTNARGTPDLVVAPAKGGPPFVEHPRFRLAQE